MNYLSVLNRTEDDLLVTLSSETLGSSLVSPSCNETFRSSGWKAFTMLQLEVSPEKTIRNAGWTSTLTLKRSSLNSRRGLEFIPCDTAPCTVYRLRLTSNHQQLIIFPRRSLSSFLAEMPSTLPLSSLMLPGTHNSVAFYGWPISQCQVPTTPLATQFASGIRVLDIRLSIINGVLIASHDIYPQKLSFLKILQAVHVFLTSSEGKNETLVISVKQEDHASLLFSQLVHSAVYDGPGGRDMWFLENRIPTLGEVRGKAVLFSRFGGNGQGWEGGIEGLGIHPIIWPDSKPEGFEWWVKETKVKTHDWYSIPSILALPEKAVRSSRILCQPTPSPLSPALSITYLSAVSIPLALPQIVACGFGWPSWGIGIEGVNSRVGKWILSLLSGSSDMQGGRKSGTRDVKPGSHGYSALVEPLDTGEPRLRGWCFMDYYGDPEDVGLVRLMVECNYRGRKSGDEGWI